MTAASSVQTVVLHIGRHKTGTSSIQATLKANRDLLLSRGVYYPDTLPPNHSGFFVNAFSANPVRHHNNTRHQRSRADIAAIVARHMKGLRKELATFSGDMAIFSAEDASTVLVPGGVRRIRKTFDRLMAPARYKIILYTRHPVSFAQSAVQQNVKGNGMYLDEAVRRHVVPTARRYSEIVAAYAEVFGEDALVLRAFEEGVKAPGGLMTDFMALAGLDAAGLDQERRNESIASEIVHFLSWLYEGPPQKRGEPFRLNRQSRVTLTEADRAALYSLPGARANFFTPDEQMQLWSEIVDDMAFLSSRFGIDYQPPAGTEPEPMFGDDFMTALNTVFPRLSDPVRQEISDFLKAQDLPRERLATLNF